MKNALFLLFLAALAVIGCGGSGGGSGGSVTSGGGGGSTSSTYQGSYSGGSQGSLTVNSDSTFAGTILGYSLSGSISNSGAVTGKILSAPKNFPPAGTPITGSVSLSGNQITFKFAYSYTNGDNTNTGSGYLTMNRQ